MIATIDMKTEKGSVPPTVLNELKVNTLKCEKCGKRRRTRESCFTEFTRCASIHGMKYLGQADRPVYEKIFWILVFSISLYFCLEIILKIWYKWLDSPLLVTFNNGETEVGNIPFPAITICPETKFDRNLFNFETIKQKGLRNKQKKYLAALQHVCSLMFKDSSDFDLPLEDHPFEVLRDAAVMPLSTCVWRNRIVECEKIFKQIFTDEGICYNFNGLSVEDLYRPESKPHYGVDEEAESTDWHRDTGYDSNVNNSYSNEMYPREAMVGKNGLVVFFAERVTENNYLCSRFTKGYKVLLHSPDNIPQVSDKFFFLPLGEAVTAIVHPGLLITPSDLKRYSPEKRSCFFSDERYLQHFKIYTQINCRLECVTNFTLSTCQCVHGAMPRLSTTPICNNTKALKCYENAAYNLLLTEFERQILNDKDEVGCNCLPPCTNIEFNIETTETKFRTDRFFSSIYFNGSDRDREHSIKYSKLQVLFKESEFLASKRTELYGLAELLSNCGGLLGLFMGISVISFVELFYFSTIRTISNRWIKSESTN